MMYRLFLPTVISLLLTACSLTPSREEPAPVEDSSIARESGETGQPERAYEVTYPEISPSEPVGPARSGAVNALLQRASEQEAEGDLSGAAATLERALGIAPHDAYLWNRLAHLRLSQDKNSMAAQMAAKSNTLARADRRLKKDNWHVIAQARQANGDLDGAQAALNRARQIP